MTLPALSDAAVALLRERAETELDRIAAYAKGMVGVAACHLRTGLTLGLNDAVYFPMASTVKVPIALAVLDVIDRGAIDAKALVTVMPVEMNPSGPLGEEFLLPGIALSVLNLMEPMITRSDNTATDVLLRLAGGPDSVRAYVEALGIAEVHPSRSIRDLLCVLYGVAPGPDQSVRDLMRATDPEALAAMRARAQAPNPAYSNDPRDQATPRGMLALLRRLWAAEGISRAARDVLLPIMGRTSTGVRRIAGRLPKGATVADKTGSAAGTTNDVGFVTMPGGDTVALAVYVKESPLPAAEREDVIADLARMAYDTLLLLTPG
jgi:beta-lactamase class A